MSQTLAITRTNLLAIRVAQAFMDYLRDEHKIMPTEMTMDLGTTSTVGERRTVSVHIKYNGVHWANVEATITAPEHLAASFTMTATAGFNYHEGHWQGLGTEDDQGRISLQVQALSKTA